MTKINFFHVYVHDRSNLRFRMKINFVVALSIGISVLVTTYVVRGYWLVSVMRGHDQSARGPNLTEKPKFFVKRSRKVRARYAREKYQNVPRASKITKIPKKYLKWQHCIFGCRAVKVKVK